MNAVVRALKRDSEMEKRGLKSYEVKNKDTERADASE